MGKDYNKKATIFLFWESSQTLKIILDEDLRDLLVFNIFQKLSTILFLFEKIKPNVFPSCSSFDQFRDYEERGDIFRELIHKKFNLTLSKN